MCYTSPMSFTFAAVGILAAAYIGLVPQTKSIGYRLFPMLLLFYSGMELLQGVQYYYVNDCKAFMNRALTEVAYLFVLVQPFMWNYFFYANSGELDRRYFIAGMAFSLCWGVMHVISRIMYDPANRLTPEMTYYASKDDTICTKKDRTHLYWVWRAVNFQDMNPTMFLYLIAWFVPALLTKKHRSVILVIVASFFLSLYAAHVSGERYTITSLWCYVSVPIVVCAYIVAYMRTQG